MMKHLQKLGKAMMLPVAALPICGILMGLGYALAPAAMGAAGATEGFAYVLGVFLIKAGAALIDNMAILFAIGVGVGLAKDNDGTAGLPTITPVLVCNSDDYTTFNTIVGKPVTNDDVVIELGK